MNTLQAHGTTAHELTQNTVGQSQPRDSHGHITAANAMEYTNANQTLIHGQDIGQSLQKNATDQTTSWPQLCTFTD